MLYLFIEINIHIQKLGLVYQTVQVKQGILMGCNFQSRILLF